MIKVLPFAALAAFSLPCAVAQTACTGGATVAGSVHDSTSALIPGAQLMLDGALSQTSGGDGRYRFPCVSPGAHQLTVKAPGFADLTTSITLPHPGALDLTLIPEVVETQIDVDAGAAPVPSSTSAGPSQTLSGKELQSLADDPDDLLRELQQLAAASGGNPASVTIAVDGFQGSSKLPPKSSIAYIQINPDNFSAEYREPPFDGGRVEVYTKPGQPTYHGALFLTNGSPWENARDPFSTSKAAIGKQRYGFELTGPIRKAGSDFSLTLEHRSIDNFAVVNAIGLDASGNTEALVSNVATPQRLWLGTARVDWQLGAKNTFIASYSANVNHLLNVGVGGTALAETGYDSETYEHMLRFSDITTVSPRLMQEARLSLRWDGENDTPNSLAPQVQVAGAFTSGGSNLGAQQLHELNTEFDDDVILTTRSHTLKVGDQLFVYNEHQRLTTNFNGTYTFGGSDTLTGLQQYQLALAGQPGGSPTAYSNVAGTPNVDFTQIENALYVQDDWNVGHRVHIAGGVRWFTQNDPTTLNAAVPRLGVLWSVDKKGNTTLNAHIGLFSGRSGEGDWAEVLREDGVHRVTSTIYNPVYGDPFANATPIHSVRTFQPKFTNLTWAAEGVGGTHTFPKGWNLSGNLLFGRIWNYARSENINSPLNDQPTGPRPGAANLNVLQVNNSGQGRVNVVFVGVENHTYKRLQFFVGGVRVNLVDDTDDNTFFTPQKTGSDLGEFAHRTNQGTWQVFGNATLNLPEKLALSGDFHAQGEQHYNITTGFDNNGDGDFNDRPQYALAGDTSGISTPYGTLVNSGGTGVLPRNKGVLPWGIYLDTNLQRAFVFTHNQKADHQQTLTLNLRSSNVLNHTNVTAIGGVLGSPLFGVPYAADNGRRVEAGARYSF